MKLPLMFQLPLIFSGCVTLPPVLSSYVTLFDMLFEVVENEAFAVMLWRRELM